MIKGVDVSSVQGEIPWAKLAALGYQFSLIKGQQGNDGCDPRFVLDVAAATAAGIEPMAYHFAYPLRHIAPKDQAAMMVAAHRRAFFDVGRPMFIDCEWPERSAWVRWDCSPAEVSTYLRDLFTELVALGARPGLYTYPFWWTGVHEADVSWATQYPLWLAAYVKAAPQEGDNPHLLNPWKTWTFWQWDGTGGARLPNGVDSDFDVFNGDTDALRAFLKGTK